MNDVHPDELMCPDCGASMFLMDGKYGLKYRCQKDGCRGAHGAHPDGSPLGTPADRGTRMARVRAHDAFDRIWSHKIMSRTEAYIWMAEKLGLLAGKAHISDLDEEGCVRVIEVVRSSFPVLFPFDPDP